jgi:hypothetical protein
MKSNEQIAAAIKMDRGPRPRYLLNNPSLSSIADTPDKKYSGALQALQGQRRRGLNPKYEDNYDYNPSRYQQ